MDKLSMLRSRLHLRRRRRSMPILLPLALINLCFGLSSSLSQFGSQRVRLVVAARSRKVSAALTGNGSAPTSFDYDFLIIGAGVGGHGAALHSSVEKLHWFSGENPKSEVFLYAWLELFNI